MLMCVYLNGDFFAGLTKNWFFTDDITRTLQFEWISYTETLSILKTRNHVEKLFKQRYWSLNSNAITDSKASP